MNFYEFEDGLVVNLEHVTRVEPIKWEGSRGKPYFFKLSMRDGSYSIFSGTSEDVVEGWRNDLLSALFPPKVTVSEPDFKSLTTTKEGVDILTKLIDRRAQIMGLRPEDEEGDGNDGGGGQEDTNG